MSNISQVKPNHFPSFPNPAMLPSERQQMILERLSAEGSVRTVGLAADLGVTDETIRKDFEALENRGELVRVHGGATRPERPRIELSLTERQSVRLDAKRAIARAAAARIQPNETIFIDASSTALTLTEFLPDFPITVLTNAHNVVTALGGRDNIEVFCTGGLFEQRSSSYIGLSAESALRRYHIHRMFFSGSAVELERGVSETNPRQAAFKERVIPCASEICLLADSSKLGAKASFFFASIDQLTTLVTNPDADPAFIRAIEQGGVNVILAD